MRLGRRGEAVPSELVVGPGERVLAWCRTEGGPVLAGTRDALYLTGPEALRIPWEEVETAGWNRDTSVLRISEVGTWGLERPVHEVTIEEPASMLELLRERVSASVVLQRHVPVGPRRGLRVIARRAPAGDRPVQWFFEYDEGVDPEDPTVRAVADAALAQAQDDVGTA